MCHFGPVPNRYYKNSLFCTMVNENWWDRPGHKKMTHFGTRPGPGCNYGETAVFTFCRKADFAQKSLCYRTLDFVNGPFVALETADFVPSTFRFREAAVFVKEPGQRTDKSSLTLLWGHHLPITVLSLSAHMKHEGRIKLILK